MTPATEKSKEAEEDEVEKTQEEEAEQEEEDEEEEVEEEEQGPLVPGSLGQARERRRQLQESLMSDASKEVVLVIDRWLRFRVTALEAAQLFCLRERLTASFALKVGGRVRAFTSHFSHGCE